MKTFFSSLLVALIVTTSTAGFAATNDPAAVAKVPGSYQMSAFVSPVSSKLNLLIEKQKGTALRVQVLNEQGKSLLTEQVGKHTTSLRFRFDLSQLPDGKYEVVVSDGATRTVKEVNLQTTTPVQSDRVISMN